MIKSFLSSPWITLTAFHQLPSVGQLLCGFIQSPILYYEANRILSHMLDDTDYHPHLNRYVSPYIYNILFYFWYYFSYRLIHSLNMSFIKKFRDIQQNEDVPLLLSVVSIIQSFSYFKFRNCDMIPNCLILSIFSHVLVLSPALKNPCKYCTI